MSLLYMVLVLVNKQFTVLPQLGWSPLLPTLLLQYIPRAPRILQSNRILFLPWHLSETHQWKLTSPPAPGGLRQCCVCFFLSCFISLARLSALFLGLLQYSWSQSCLYGHFHHRSEKPSWKKHLHQLFWSKNKTTPWNASLSMTNGGIRNQVIWENDWSGCNPLWVLTLSGHCVLTSLAGSSLPHPSRHRVTIQQWD